MVNTINVSLGRKLRLRRLVLGMSQTMLAKAMGISFQQIQKYENGKNSLSAERLVQLSQCLGVSITYFFDDLESVAPDAGDSPKRTKNVDRQKIAMLNAFSNIYSPLVRTNLLKLVESLALRDSEPNFHHAAHENIMG